MKSWMLIALVVLLPNPANAYTGGPVTAEVLGWDPADHKVFVALHHHDESGYRPFLIYFKLDGSTDSLGTVVPWSMEDQDWSDSTNNSKRDKQWKAVTRRLKPLVEMDAGTIPKSKQIIETTHLKNPDVARYRVVIGWLPHSWNGLGHDIEVEAYSEPTVNFHRLYSIPGRQDVLGIIAFIGRPDDGGDETQVPILIRAGSNAPIKVRWRWWEK